MTSKIYSQEQFDLIDQWYNEHPSVNSIAEKYRRVFGTISEMTIAKYLKANGYKTFSRGKKPPLSDDAKKLMMAAKFQRDACKVDLSGYSNYEKIAFLSRRFSTFRWKFDITFTRQEFFARFYFDKHYNEVFDIWKQNHYHTLLTPSFDHIVPVAKNGSTSLENLQCLPIWENRAKYDLTQMEWEAFKAKFL